jgi:uncharacterized protein
VSDPGSLIARVEEYVRREMEGDSGGHDWWHIERVRATALRLAREEHADELVVELAALLHDVADHKLSGSEEAGPTEVERWLSAHDVPEELAKAVVSIVAGVSFKGADVADPPLSIEGECVRDADRLDAMGALGIARAFAFGGQRGRVLHDPAAAGTTIDHFHEKLLLLEERMSTASGRRIAERRHQVMLQFLDEFEREWSARDG